VFLKRYIRSLSKKTKELQRERDGFDEKVHFLITYYKPRVVGGAPISDRSKLHTIQITTIP
jgi:hypothetical protein